MKPKTTALPALVCALLTGTALAQPRVDIDLHRNSAGGVDVQLTPETDFDGVPSSLVFTITWDGAAAGTVPELRQSAEQRALMTLSPSGPVHEVGDKRYRIYSGIGLTPLSDGGRPWRAGMSLTIATFGPDVPTDLLIANDDWVHQRRNNGTFYVSLNGLDRTGHIFKRDPAGNGDSGLFISAGPNPWNGGPLAVEILGIRKGELRLELTDALGKIIWYRTHDNIVNDYRTNILTDSPLSAGNYTLTVKTPGVQKSMSIAVMGGSN